MTDREQHRKAIRALNAGRYETAARLARELLLKDDQFADGWFVMAMVAAANFKVDKALELLNQAVLLAPNKAEYLAQQAKLYTMTHQHAAAKRTADAAAEAGEFDPLTADTLGVTYAKLGEFDRSRIFLTQAVERASENPQFHFNLASTCQFLGDMARAGEHYQRAIDLAPTFYRARWALAELNKNDPDLDSVDEIAMHFAKDDLKADERLYLGHALYYAYEKAGEYARAFQVLQEAKRMRIAQITYSVKRDERLFETLQTALPAGNSENSGSECIFVVGMPRTGTTLVEQILDSHRDVTSLGERQDFALSIKRASEDRSRELLNDVIAGAASKQAPHNMAEYYLDRIRQAASQTGVGSGQRLVDKMPLNFLLLGFVFRVLPGARVVVVRRNPMDTVFSNFRQLFAINYSYYNYAYDLGDAAAYYVLFDRLMAHWQSLFPERYYEVQYEGLLEDPHKSVREVLEHLELPWDEECLKFYKNRRAVSTASTAQVRRPLYRDAVARWRRYEEFLQPVQTIFARHGLDYGESAGGIR